MSHHRIELQSQIEIGASAETVYGLIADSTRTGEWSPECIAATWTDGEPGLVGSQFVGSNLSETLRLGRSGDGT